MPTPKSVYWHFLFMRESQEWKGLTIFLPIEEPWTQVSEAKVHNQNEVTHYCSNFPYFPEFFHHGVLLSSHNIEKLKIFVSCQRTMSPFALSSLHNSGVQLQGALIADFVVHMYFFFFLFILWLWGACALMGSVFVYKKVNVEEHLYHFGIRILLFLLHLQSLRFRPLFCFSAANSANSVGTYSLFQDKEKKNSFLFLKVITK